MYDSRGRQKFISDAQYVREMQHKMDSEYQACLRRQEQNREQTEKKREQHARQEQRQKTLSSIYATRSYERPWISGIPVTRQTSADEGSGSAIKSSANRSDSKFPTIEKISSKQKQKPPMSSSKVTPAAQKQSLLRRKRMNQGGLLGSPDIQNMRKLEDKDRRALLLQAKAQVTSASDLGVTNETTLMNKKRSQERRNVIQSSKLNLDRKGLDKDSKIGSVLPQTQQSPTLSSASTLQGAHGSFVSDESHSPSFIPTKMAPLRFRDENFYSMLCLNMEDSCEENDTKDDDILEKEFLSFNLNHSPTPLEQISKFSGTSLAQDEQCNSAETGDDRSISSRSVESSHQPLRQHNVMDTTVEQSSLRQRNFRDYGKSYTPDGNSSEGADCNKNENETPLFSSRSSRAESRPGSAPIAGTLNNISSIDRPSVNIYNRELQAYESNQRRYTDLLTSARSTVHRPLLYSAYNTPRSLIQSAHRAEVSTTVSSQVLDLDGSSRFNVRRPLSPIRSRDSFSATESYESSSPIVSTPEDNSLLDDSIDNGLKSTSANAALHDEENLLNSHSSFLSIDSSSPSLFQTNFTAHLHMAGTLHDQLPLALLAVSDLQNQSSSVSSIAACDTTSAKEINKHADPEKLKKLQESLLAEDSEEEGDQCRICQIAGGSLTNPLVEPCGCVGTLQFVHQECLKTWLKAKIKSGAELGAVKTCELCKQSLIADLDDFDVNDYYRNHQQSRAQSELMNSGLYLVLLLHLYEQRFAELMRLNYNQASRARIQSQGTMDRRVLTRLSNEFGIWQRSFYIEYPSPCDFYPFFFGLALHQTKTSLYLSHNPFQGVHYCL
ncbi:probable E3 ubiquitin-protein ligase MARCHF10 isoform X1 [Gopherus flavomarginatus]|uniref:probable E3 ubiquitin-protein ligase MARCHF10 isoform X1 n=1 Tax=Gopherus flavomarginatus TaxID=286002 RepID=UPI0021CC3DAF|nr:probable E3 ubiquitin-protein ligase MARCHF10 isoform X1 [Gopherus flavomarginatus]XP_050790883.1 probable E3 ubiquitin-protein ligase MARCHF10 isoform X1 [Gopherus flavomarginatus]